MSDNSIMTYLIGFSLTLLALWRLGNYFAMKKLAKAVSAAYEIDKSSIPRECGKCHQVHEPHCIDCDSCVAYRKVLAKKA